MPLRRARGELCHSQQVVGDRHQVGGELRLHDPNEAALSQATDRLHPAEDLLDPLALSLADAVALVARGARIQPQVQEPAKQRNSRL